MTDGSIAAVIRRTASRPGAGALLVGIVLAFGLVYGLAQAMGIVPEAFDAKAYWLADQTEPYARATVGQAYAYLYSPAFIQLFAPFQLVPWPLFTAIWTVLMVLALVWTAGPWALPLLAILPVFSAVTIGNIEFFLAAAIVAGFRYPASWAFVLLTKSSMGVGLVWFLVRREWRDLLIALAATAAIAGLSFVVAPRLWFDWLGVLDRNVDTTFYLWTLPGPLWLRVAVAALIVCAGAATNRRWVVPVAAAIALPVAYASLFVIGIVGAVGLLRREPGSVVWRLERRERRSAAPSRAPTTAHEGAQA